MLRSLNNPKPRAHPARRVTRRRKRRQCFRAPQSPSTDLIAPLFAGKRALVLASPSLAVAGDFEYVRGALKLPETTAVASLIADRVDQTLLGLPSDVPEPNAPRYQRALEETLIRLATALDGGCSRSSPHTPRCGPPITVFAGRWRRRISSSSARGRMARCANSGKALPPSSVSSCWAPAPSGMARCLRRHPPACVVVTKLPFPAMSDPLLAARAEQWDDAQHQFVVPQAALKLRQALSGLAWSHSERNAVVLFDRRVQTRGYGASIVGSLPRCTQHEEPVDALTERIAEWVGPVKSMEHRGVRRARRYDAYREQPRSRATTRCARRAARQTRCPHSSRLPVGIAHIRPDPARPNACLLTPGRAGTMS